MLKKLPFFALLVISSIAPALAMAAPVSLNVGARGQILVVMTNHSRYPSRDDTTGLWLTELTHFTDMVEAAGYATVFASPKGGQVPLDERSLGWLYMDKAARKHLASAGFKARLSHTLPISQANPADYQAIYFTGGHGVMWDFRGNDAMRRVAEGIYNQGGVIASVCHGAAALLNLQDSNGQPLIKGRTITGFSNREEFLAGLKSQVPFFLEDELKAEGADYKRSWLPFKSYVLTDGRIVTGQNPASAKAVGKAVLAVLSANSAAGHK
ncbi:MAG: type 1 glutamine amidotransferase domain-containing protein [Alcanivorax sp.]|nr:type 1 glutamine amidotransferase domain-containing protein [Alcanivorax sp.]